MTEEFKGMWSWWKSSNNDLPKDVFAYVHNIQQNQSYRSSDNLRHARLYGNYEMLGLDAYSYTKANQVPSISNRVTLNVIQSMIDTVVSKITKNKPRPTFLTSEGNWQLKQKAKKLTKFVDGVFNSTKFYEKASLAFLDSCIFGTGAVKIFESDGEIKAERVFIEELLLDDVESFYGEPRQLHQKKYIHKDILIEMFPDKQLEIESANASSDAFKGNYNAQKKNMVEVIESWHLPSGKGASDGKRTITVPDCLLFQEEYDKHYFPFVFYRWGIRPVGFFGQGLAEQLKGIQLEINKILRTIQVSMHLVSVPKLLVEASSKIVTAHLNNKIGGVIKYAGTPPQYSQMGTIPSDLFSHLDRLYQRAYEISGISQLSAQSLKPSGLDSGKALREFNDLETERFLAIARRYETSFIDAAEIMIDLARDIYKKDKKFEVQVKGRKFIETIKWSEVDMEEDKYMMDIFPTSSLSQTPAGRLQDVQDLIQAGFISQEEGLKLLDFPDLEGAMNMLNADSNNLEKIINKMMETGRYISPEPYQNLENAIRKVQQAYLMFSMEGAPDEKLELLRQYMEDAQGLIIKSQEQAPTPAQMTEELALEGASGAAAAVAQQSELGSEPLNPLVEGAIDLGAEDQPLPEESSE